MAIIRWNPLRDVTAWNSGNDLTSGLASIQREMDRMFDQFMRNGGSSNEEGVSTYLPPVDIVEHDNEFIVTAELPGVKKDEVKITVTNDILTISGEKHQETGKKDKNYHRLERSIGSFQRSFSLPASIRPDRIEAVFNDGILAITLPKAEEAKPKQIDIKIK